jgi:hypothetical protein
VGQKVNRERGEVNRGADSESRTWRSESRARESESNHPKVNHEKAVRLPELMIVNSSNAGFNSLKKVS